MFKSIKSGTSCIAMSLGKSPRDSQETFGRACQIGHTVLRSATTPTDAFSSHQRSRKRIPIGRRALQLLASCRDGCTEALMLADGFTVEQMVERVRAGLATAQAGASSPAGEPRGRAREDHGGGAAYINGMRSRWRFIGSSSPRPNLRRYRKRSALCSYY